MKKRKDICINNHINAPIEMCIYAVSNNIENPFRLFIYLKLSYPSGKFRWSVKERKKAALFLKCHIKTVDNNFQKNIELEWLIFYKQKKCGRMISFDNLRNLNNWSKRTSFPFSNDKILNIRASLGAILYTQLFISYSRKYLNRGKTVQKNGCAAKITTSSCYNSNYADISVKAVRDIFGISQSKAVRLKQEAEKAKYIKVKKNYYLLDKDEVFAAMKNSEYNERSNNIVCYKGKYAYQLTDKIYSELYFKKRKKLKTL